MSRDAVTDEIFFNRAGLDRPRTEGIVADALHGADDGELFLEYRQSESFSFDDGRLKSASFDSHQGFGLRAVSGETTAYAHAGELGEDALKRASAPSPPPCMPTTTILPRRSNGPPPTPTTAYGECRFGATTPRTCARPSPT